MKYKVSLALVLALGVMSLANAESMYMKSNGQPWKGPSLTVQGTSQKEVRANRASLVVALNRRVDDLNTGYKNMQADLEKVLAAIKKVSAGQKVVYQTQDFNIYPHYDSQYDQKASANVLPKYYQINASYNVMIDGVKNIDQIIMAALGSGANSFSNLNFSLAEPAGIEEEVQIAAYEKAAAKAQKIAKDLDIKLGNPVTITLNSYERGGSGPRPFMFAKAANAGAGAPAEGFGAGQDTLVYQGQANVVYAIEE